LDPVSIIVTALVTGAAAGLQPTAAQVIKDSYASIKDFIKRRYGRVEIEPLERNPASKARQDMIKEDLESADAGNDQQLLLLAKAMLEAIEKHAPEVAPAVGVDLKDVRSASLRIERIIATGPGVRIERADSTGDITITDVRAGQQGPQPPK
jgi:hypothetical protein